MINLETAVTTRGTPEPKQFHFRAPASAYDAVKAAGIDVVSIANNHGAGGRRAPRRGRRRGAAAARSSPGSRAATAGG
ncbi:CapA family protein [Micromonospora musae]|uniref:CapA family protein n=1 Tax=Micromonospora musae TaxID=1894970 RepID=UPI003F4CE004